MPVILYVYAMNYTAFLKRVLKFFFCDPVDNPVIKLPFLLNILLFAEIFPSCILT